MKKAAGFTSGFQCQRTAFLTFIFLGGAGRLHTLRYAYHLFIL